MHWKHRKINIKIIPEDKCSSGKTMRLDEIRVDRKIWRYDQIYLDVCVKDSDWDKHGIISKWQF